ncbi:hypothetical protein U4E84_03230 [Halorubrum sp. AD140]|uniref:hypothetical protein n=1 Tax=Halorubrum sp. AD140 TaxID=3050073 RepID=UPI002ACC6195|nr:hypothetical protein [Halorubrum sp. AD140]MDZ5810366.1 hypothetical protein [Halorubrum sp. AD140]
MLGKYFALMRWWVRKWYPVFRWFGRVTDQEEYVERAIAVTEDNFERILEGDDE